MSKPGKMTMILSIFVSFVFVRVHALNVTHTSYIQSTSFSSVEATSVLGDEYQAENAIDNTPGTYWRPSRGGSSANILAVLEASLYVSAVDVVVLKGSTVGTIEINNGESIATSAILYEKISIGEDDVLRYKFKTPVNIEKIRIYTTQPRSFGIADIRLFEAEETIASFEDELENVSEGALADDTEGVQNIFDGDEGTFWTPTQADEPEITLGAFYQVVKLRMSTDNPDSGRIKIYGGYDRNDCGRILLLDTDSVEHVTGVYEAEIATVSIIRKIWIKTEIVGISVKELEILCEKDSTYINIARNAKSTKVFLNDGDVSVSSEYAAGEQNGVPELLLDLEKVKNIGFISVVSPSSVYSPGGLGGYKIVGADDSGKYEIIADMLEKWAAFPLVTIPIDSPYRYIGVVGYDGNTSVAELRVFEKQKVQTQTSKLQIGNSDLSDDLDLDVFELTAEITNNSESPGSCEVVLAMFNENGTIEALASSFISLTANETKNISVELNNPYSELPAGAKLKAFFWEDGHIPIVLHLEAS